MLVTLLGMVMDVRLEQCANAELPMVVTPSGMVTFLMLLSSTRKRIVPDSSNMKISSFMVDNFDVTAKL